MTNDQAALLATMIWGGFKLLSASTVLSSLILGMAVLWKDRLK